MAEDHPEEGQELNLEELKKISGGNLGKGELDDGDICLLNAFVISCKELNMSLEATLAKLLNLGVSGEALLYVGTHWDAIN